VQTFFLCFNAMFIFANMSWFAFSLTAIVSIILLLKAPLSKKSGLRKSFILLAFLIKFIAGSALTLVYTYYYSERGAADIYKFFDDAQVIATALPEKPGHYFRLISGWDDENPELLPYRKAMRNWEPQSSEWLEFTQTQSYNFFTSNRIITRINAILLPLSGGNIFTHVLVFSLLITLASLSFLNTFRFEGKFNPYLTASIILFWPSVLMWCGAPLKDALTLAAIFFSWSAFYKILQNPAKYQSWLQLVFWLSILLFTKYYVLPALLAGGFLCFVYKFSSPAFRVRNTLFTIIVGLIAIFIFEAAFPEKNLSVLLNNKREEALKAAIFGEARQMAFVGTVDGSFWGMLEESPKAIFRAVFLPLYPSDNSPIIMFPAIAENILLLAIVLFTLLRLLKSKRLPATFFPFLIFVLVLAWIIGYTTPVVGGIVRYKTAFLPILLMLCIHIVDINSVHHRQTRINKTKG